MKEKEGKTSAGAMKGEPNERGQADDRPDLIKKPVAKPGLLVSTPRAKEEWKKRRKRRKREKGRDEGAPSYDTSVQDTPKRKGSQL